MRRRQSGRIVHAIANHGNLIAFFLQLAYQGMLVLGKKIRPEFVHARCFCSLLSSTRIVTRKHDNALEAFSTQLIHHFFRTWLQRILDVDNAR